MIGWVEFSVALLLFLASHAIPAWPSLRANLVDRFGLRGYLAGYSVLSILLLWWLIAAAGRAPYVPLFPPLRAVPLMAMPWVVWLAVEGLRHPNPLSLGRGGAFDPAQPGLLAVTRHPLLWALTLWAVAHLLANGDLASVIVFGLFAGFSGAAMVLVDRRMQRKLGADWPRLAAHTARLNLRQWRQMPLDWITLAITMLIYLLFLALHLPVIGVSPWP